MMACTFKIKLAELLRESDWQPKRILARRAGFGKLGCGDISFDEDENPMISYKLESSTPLKSEKERIEAAELGNFKLKGMSARWTGEDKVSVCARFGLKFD